MLLTIVGDPHAKPDNLDKINTLFDMIEDLGNECVILGDLLDTKEVVRGKCLNTYIRRFKQSKLKFWVLVGNHDWFNLECKEHALEVLKELSNVTVVDKCLRYQNLDFIAYYKDQNVLKEYMKIGSGKTLFCHADIKSFDYGNGLISEEGLDAKDFSGYKRVISGHYHKYQKQGNITYLGTPFSHSFGETNQDKYIGVYDTKTDELELLPTPFPKHMTYELDASQKKFVEERGDIVRVILKGTQEQIDKYQKQEGVKYIERPDALVKSSVINEAETPQVQFSKWGKTIKGYSDELVEKGLEILRNV